VPDVFFLRAEGFGKNGRLRYIPGDKEERTHGVHVAEGRLRLGHLDGGDAEAPEVAPVVVGSVWVLVARDHLRGHPVGRPDKCVPEQDKILVELHSLSNFHWFNNHCSLNFLNPSITKTVLRIRDPVLL
jgi:hypothetical protein